VDSLGKRGGVFGKNVENVVFEVVVGFEGVSLNLGRKRVTFLRNTKS
jgi:hypothetical protein